MASIFFLLWDLFRGILRSECGHILCRSLKRFSVHYAMHVFVFDGNWRSCVFYSLRRLYCPCIIFQTVTQPWMVNLHFLPLSSALLRSHTESDTGGTEAECLHNLVAANMQYFIKTVFYYCLMLHPFRGVHCVQRDRWNKLWIYGAVLYNKQEMSTERNDSVKKGRVRD